MRSKRRSTTRKYVMYGGAPTPAPAPARFPGQPFDADDIEDAFNDYLQAAYSMNEAAKAIQETSQFQNNSDPNPSLTGTRNLQKTSALSFSTAASSFLNSLKAAYGSLSSGQGIVVPPASAFAPRPAPRPAPVPAGSV